MKSKVTIAQGAALLAISGYLSKMISFFYRIPYQNIAGDIGLYVYQTVYPLFAIASALGIYALPVIVAKLTLHHPEERREVLWSILWAMLVLTGLFGGLGWWLAPSIAALFGDARLVLPIRAVTLTFYLLPFIAVLRGMFQAEDEMRPTAFSQIAENGTRVVLLLFATALSVSLGYSPYLTGALAHASAAGGSIVSLILLLKMAKGRIGRPVFSKRHVMRVGKVLITSGFAVSVASLALLLMQLIDGLTFVNLLGDSLETKTEKGIFDRGYPLLQFAILFATTISLASMPSLLKAYRKRNHMETTRRLELLLRSGLAIAAAAAVGLAGVMRPLNIAFFEDGKGTTALIILASSAFFASLSMIIVSCLQAVDAEKYAFVGVCAGLAAKLTMNIWLLPRYGMIGAGMATFLGFAVMALSQTVLLNRKFGRVTAGSRFYTKLAVSLSPMALFLVLMDRLFESYGFDSRLGSLVEVGVLIAGGGALFLYMMLKTRLLTEQEWGLLPFGEKIMIYEQRRRTL